MIKKITIAFVGVLLLFILTIYIAIRALPMPSEFPANVILKPSDGWQGEDSIIIKATDIYPAGFFRKLLFGENYRLAWDAPIRVPVVGLDTLYGGLKILDSGGGGQTRSLTLVDSAGVMYTLRTVCKDASANIPDLGKRLRIENLVADAISAGHPFGAFPAAALADAAGLAHTHPKLVYVPQQPALDTFSERYADRLFLLEYEPKGKNGDWTGIDSVFALMKSEDVKDSLLENPDHRADPAILLKARLLDLVIGDWDRHDGNWGWIAHHQNGTTVYTPFPVDRDMAFYGIGGIVPWLINRPGNLEKFRPFQTKIDYLPGMVRNSHPLDAFFLNEMTKEDFLSAASQLQHALTDEVIERVVKTWPDTLYQLNGREIVQKIIAHRNDLPKYAEEFYELLAKEPQVVGTEKVDSFIVERLNENDMAVAMFAQTDSGKTFRRYFRVFDKKETQSVTLFGLDGNDSFDIHGDLPIQLNIVGGNGLDSVRQNELTDSKHSHIALMDDPDGMSCPKGFTVEAKKVKILMPDD